MNASEATQRAQKCVDDLSVQYKASVARLQKALKVYLEDGTFPDKNARENGDYSYPELKITYNPDGPPPQISRSYGKFSEGGIYATTITNPELFRRYLVEQLELLFTDYDVDTHIGPSDKNIPYSYVLDGANDLDMGKASPSELAGIFPYADLVSVGDELADGEMEIDTDKEPLPLSLFDAPRTDYSLFRLRHYTGTPFEDVQQFILFTNYHRYVDEFVKWAVDEVQKEDSEYTSFSAAGFVTIDKDTPDAVKQINKAPWRKYQMPAYHLKAAGGRGVTLVNIGVGPSNAKTATDHLAVLRPQCWLMIGHCGGLRQSQRLGDYVLAHAYLRDDHVLDTCLPLEIPIPPLAEIQTALQVATSRVSGEGPEKIKSRLRTGTVVTKDDRNWELRYSAEARLFNKSRAIAVDMESATIAANGFRLRVPYGTLLCVSDKPLHGEIKLPGAANIFYERSINEHLRIGLETINILKTDVANALHSRKLRAFNEPPFR
ncbi:MAG: AMP nucleosidase [Robiginitomaculum sp.]|nr:MAG: AMP nucleosidase [Robiginitomaculum sp.]